MSPHRIIGTLVMVLGLGLAPTLVFAQPGQTSLVSVQEAGSYTFTFARVAGATWYYLWVNEGGTARFRKWFTAGEVGCAGTEVNCFIAVALPRAAFGTHGWWVQTYGPAGYGPWSLQGSWTSRPPMPPMVTDSTGRYVGSLLSDSEVFLDVDGLPALASIFRSGFFAGQITLLFLQAGCAGPAYSHADFPDQIVFTTGVSQGYLIRGTPISATALTSRLVDSDGTVGACNSDGAEYTMMPVTQKDMTSQLGSLTMPLKVVR